MRTLGRCVLGSVLLVSAIASDASRAFARDLTIDDRVAAQRAIEQVYWSHRIWPKENPGPKPALSAVMPDTAIRAKVDDYLRMSSLLATYWNQPITAEQLQNELSRMTRETKAPDTLRDLFAALHDDPFLIAECLVRPSLTQRRVQAAFASDARIHGPTRDALASKLRGVSNLQAFLGIDGDHAEVKFVRDQGGSSASRASSIPADGAIHLSRSEWDREIAWLSAGFGVPASEGVTALPVGKVSAIVDDENRFTAFAVRSKDATSVTVASVSATKRAYVDWSRDVTGMAVPDASAIAPPAGGYKVTQIPLTVCTDDTWERTNLDGNVAAPRYDHTSVWTGSEMIVWGGFGTTTLNTGGRYVPATDSWTPSTLNDGSGANVPGPRGRHTAVWTGTEMIVWGGYSGGDLNTGGRFNPTTDTWTASSLTSGGDANVPSLREVHTAVWTGSVMIVWGGYHSGTVLNTGGLYDPASDSWLASSLNDASGPNTPDARFFHSAVWTGSEMIVWGGYDYTNFVDLNSGGRYNPTTDAWAASSLTTGSGANVPSARDSHSAVWTGSEMIVWGGFGDVDIVNTGGRYDPTTDTWSLTSLNTASGANVPNARYNHTAVWTGTEMIVWGGTFLHLDNTSDYFNTGGRYNPATDTWAASSLTTGSGANTPGQRSAHSAVWTGSEMVVWGGFNGSNPLNTGGRYDPVTDTWAPTNTFDPNTPRQQHTAVWTGAEMILWGGFSGTSLLNSGERYDPATDTWVASSLHSGSGANIADARYAHASVWTGSEMIVWGGYGNSGYVNTGGRYNPLTDSWAASSLVTGSGSNVPVGRQNPTAVWTGSEMIVWGGYAATGVTNTGGRYSPASDSWASSSLTTGSGPNVPSARAYHTAIWTGSELIVWGGFSDHHLNTGGRYDPTTDTWAASSLNTGSGPNVAEARILFASVWTGSELIVWGGEAQSGYTNNGGRYNPSTDSWTTTSLTTASGANVPGPRQYPSAVWTGSEMIVWGGAFSGPENTGGRYSPYTDSWAASSLTTGSGADVPSGRYVHTAVWTGSQMVVWGGASDSGTLKTGGQYCAVCPVLTWYRDADGDGHGNPGVTVTSCTPPAGYVIVGDDCNDANSAIHPGAPEICDGIDENCDSVADDGGSALCDDGNVCTSDTCNGAAGCTHGNLTGPCNDGNACTAGGSCVSAGGCGTTESFDGVTAPALPSGWTSSVIGTGAAWITQSTTPDTPPNSAFGFDGGSVADEVLVSPPIAISSSSATLTFRNRWSFESSTSCFDAGVLEIQIGAGSFTDIVTAGGSFVSGGYTGTVSSSFNNPLHGRSAWCLSSPGYPAYVTTVVHLPAAAAGQTIQLRWRVGTDTSTGSAGQNIDSIAIGDACTSTCVGDLPVNCDDGNPCTDDSCDPATGCVHLNNSAPCDDGDACTPNDTCHGGLCVAPATFTGSNVPAGAGPRRVVAGDWNGDGAMDLAVDDFDSNSVTILLGDGSGGFAPAAGSPVSVGYYPVDLVAADFNRDGKLDLATGNSGTVDVTILLGDGHGAFAPAPGGPNTFPASPSGLAAGDLNGDGAPDLAVLTAVGIEVLLGNGSGQFSLAPGSPVAVPNQTSAIELGDLNGDGKLDVVTTSIGTNMVTILLGDGVGGLHLAVGSPFSVGDEPIGIAIGDLNRDGRPDLAVPGLFTNSVRVYLGDGSGRFVAAPGPPTPTGAEPYWVVAGDWNLDGNPDLAVASGAGVGLTVLLGDGSGRFAESPGSPIPTFGQAFYVTSGDWDGDHRPDLVSASGGAGTVRVVLNRTIFSADGTACDDGNACTSGDACTGGLCAGTGGDCAVSVDPPDNATGVPIGTNVTLTVHDPIDPASVSASTFRLIGPNEVAVPATRVLSSSGKQATLDPAAALAPGATYRVEATSGLQGPGGASIQPFTSYFRTAPGLESVAISSVSEATNPLPTLAKGGSSVSGTGDLNRDGIKDFVSGAPGYTDASHGVPVEAGAALVYFGSRSATERSAPDVIFTGAAAHDRAGVSVASGFDFNGDGYPDILIGAEQVDRTTNPNSPVATGNGKAYLIFFDPNDTVHYPNIGDPAVPDTVSLSLVGQPGGIPGVVFTGVAFGDQAGFSVAGGGTSAPSAGTDILIGAPGADPGGRTDAGAAYVVFANPELSGQVSLSRVSSGAQDQIPGKAYYGSAPGDSLGFSTMFAGPLVLAQSPDRGTLVIGAPGADGKKGKVVSAPGDTDTTPIIVDAVGRTAPGFQIRGTQVGEQLGWAVGDSVDAQADRVTDLLIGAPTYDVSTPLQPGLTLAPDAGRVIHMSQQLASGLYDADAIGTTIRGVIWQGAAAGDQLGFAVAGVGDVTGDGYDDVVLGAPFVDAVVGGATLTDAGAVYRIDGSPVTGLLGVHSVAEVGTTIAGRRFTGTQSGEHAGSSIAGTGDLSGDGRNDFVVGAPDRDAHAGTVYMVLRGAAAAVGNCGPGGCQVVDLANGAELDVPAGGLTADLNLTVNGILDDAALPAPVPAGLVLLGAARFGPDGQQVLPPGAAIYIPTEASLPGTSLSSAVLPLSAFNGAGWVPSGISGTVTANPSYPSKSAVAASVAVLGTYAVFVDHCFNVVCDDGNPCTDDSCDPATGCQHANNTAPCDDGNPATSGDTCQAGVCAGSSCQLTPHPKSSGYYKKLCKDGHSHPSNSDALTVTDAVCVGQLTATFAGISTVEDLCAVVDHDSGGSHHDSNGPLGKECTSADAELMALALNICRGYVCEAQEVDSGCSGGPHDHTLTTVADSLAATDAILADPARNKTTCKDARCLAREINNGHGLHHTSLLLAKDTGNKLRLSWESPVMEDGSGDASSYTIWRRGLNANAAFVAIGVTSQRSYVDATAGTGNYEYEVTFTIEP